uniref:Cytochrome P450 20A1 n=1 Tax=Magallana gigas TaxID=29159 RepID=K1Q0B7_MAGGI
MDLIIEGKKEKEVGEKHDLEVSECIEFTGSLQGYQETVQMVSKVLTILYRKLDKQGLRLYVHSPDGMKNDHRDGNLADIAKAESLHEYVIDLHQKYGDIAAFWMGKEMVLSENLVHDWSNLAEMEQIPLNDSMITFGMKLTIVRMFGSVLCSDGAIKDIKHSFLLTSVINALGASLQSETYFSNPKRFDPDRFSEENIKSRPAYAFQPFGFAGKRMCPGYNLAITGAIALLYQYPENFPGKIG